MRQARAKGGSFWYCPHSRGRAVTLEMAKKYLGEDGAREIWIRSQYQFRPSVTPCPSCTRPMRSVTQPGWMGGGEVDVCRGCHFVWINPGEHPAVPGPGDLITPEGDSTIVKDRVEGARDYLIAADARERDRSALMGEGSEGLLARLPAFLGLPVEMSDRGRAEGAWLTWALFLIVFAIHVATMEMPTFLSDWGFSPSDPFKHGGLNALTSVLLHGGWLHVVFNLYFFMLFSDDVEEDLGKLKYLGLLVSSALFCSIGAILVSGRPDVPHVGLSGVIMALMSYYALQFPRSRIAYLVPVVHTISLPRAGAGWISGIRWLRLPVWAVAVVFLLKDALFYFLHERTHLTQVSHSVHLSGMVAGIVFWFVFSKRRIDRSRMREAETGRAFDADARLREKLTARITGPKG